MFFRNLKWDIIGQRNIWFAISIVVIVAGIAALVMHHGLKLGLSFTGGSTIEVKFSQSVTVVQVRDALKSVVVTPSKTTNGGAQQQSATQDLQASLQPLVNSEEAIQLASKPEDKLPDDRAIISTQTSIADSGPVYDALDKAGLTVDRSQSQLTSVGPSLGKEYLTNSLWAMLLALGLQLVYIAFRFGNQLRYGVIADVKLVHDILVMVGIYALADKPADDAFLAALLTVIGYSVMDSIVIFDRIRENSRLMTDVPYDKMVNTSLLQTMTRSVYTLATVEIVLVALYAFGGDTLKDFAFALIVGVTSGAYSSIFIASPFLVMWHEIDERRKGVRRAAMATAGGGRPSAPVQRGGAAQQAVQPQMKRTPPKQKRQAAPPPRYRRKRDGLEMPQSDGVILGAVTGPDHIGVDDEQPDQG
jgi:preprotein translocase subunit SecF